MTSFGFVPVLALTCLFWSSHAVDYYVGSKDGWTLHPSEAYNQWAQKFSFHVHDNLVFKYEKGHDSVLHVTRVNYDSCNTSNPLRLMGSGDSWFTLEQSGSFYFLSGSSDYCWKGQKMVVEVHASGATPIPPSPSPSNPPKFAPSPASMRSSAPSPSGNGNGNGNRTGSGQPSSVSGSGVWRAPVGVVAGLFVGGLVFVY